MPFSGIQIMKFLPIMRSCEYPITSSLFFSDMIAILSPLKYPTWSVCFIMRGFFVIAEVRATLFLVIVVVFIIVVVILTISTVIMMIFIRFCFLFGHQILLLIFVVCVNTNLNSRPRSVSLLFVIMFRFLFIDEHKIWIVISVDLFLHRCRVKSCKVSR